MSVDVEPIVEESTRYRMGVYGWSPGSGGVHHHRIGEPLRCLGQLGYPASSGVELDDEILSRCDTVLAHTLHTERESEAWRTLERLDSHRLVLDVDDWMWAPDWQPFRDNYTPDVLARLYDNIRRAHVVTTPTDVLAEYLLTFNPNVHVVPNTVPEWLIDHPMPERDRPTIGYQGSPSHRRDWSASYTAGLARFLMENEEWGIHFYGLDPGQLAHITHARYTPWAGSVDNYYRSVAFDVGIGPLRDTPFNRAKSGLRAIEYAARGIVAVLPDLPPYRGWVEDGVTGRLVRSHQTIRRVLNEVAQDHDTRVAMGQAAHERAKNWTTEANLWRWVTAWNSQ
jgi:hypothetical protein